MYQPNANALFSPTHGIDFWGLGIQITGIASLTGAINLIVTILNMRAPGMKLMKMPIFTWMVLVVQFLLLFAIPVITVALFLLMFDRLFGSNFFNASLGGDPLLWQHLFWIFGHPEVYILILPSFGIVSEVIPVFSRKPIFGYPFMVASGIAIGFMGFGVWTLRGDELSETDRRRAQGGDQRSAVVTASVTFFLAELGDKTMLATITLATTYAPLGVWIGSTVGMVAADALAIVVGRVLGTRLPERAVRIGAAVLFFAFGAALLAEGLIG